jgi:rod shape-determining protein MreD
MLNKNSLPRLIVLHLIAILFVIFNVSDVKIVGLTSVIPLFDLMMIFYFAVFLNVFSIWFVFLLGVWNDALCGNPLGVTALCYILLIKLFSVLNGRIMIRENFDQMWKQFIAFCTLFLLMKWAMLSFLNAAAYSLISPLVQLALSSVLYVVMHKFFDYLSQKLLDK